MAPGSSDETPLQPPPPLPHPCFNVWTTGGRLLQIELCTGSGTPLVRHVLEALIESHGYGADAQLVYMGQTLHPSEPLASIDSVGHKAVVAGQLRSDAWHPSTPAEEAIFEGVLDSVCGSSHTELERAILSAEESHGVDFASLRTAALQRGRPDLLGIVRTLSAVPGLRKIIEDNQQEFLGLLRHGIVGIEVSEDIAQSNREGGEDAGHTDAPEVTPEGEGVTAEMLGPEAEMHLSQALFDLIAGPTALEDALRECIPDTDAYLASFRSGQPSAREVAELAASLLSQHPLIAEAAVECGGEEELRLILQEGLPSFAEDLCGSDMPELPEEGDATAGDIPGVLRGGGADSAPPRAAAGSEIDVLLRAMEGGGGGGDGHASDDEARSCSSGFSG